MERQIDLKGGPVVFPALDTFTRNFKFHLYMRAGTGFTANGVGQTFDFNNPGLKPSATVVFVWATKTTSILRRVRSGPTCLGMIPTWWM